MGKYIAGIDVNRKFAALGDFFDGEDIDINMNDNGNIPNNESHVDAVVDVTIDNDNKGTVLSKDKKEDISKKEEIRDDTQKRPEKRKKEGKAEHSSVEGKSVGEVRKAEYRIYMRPQDYMKLKSCASTLNMAFDEFLVYCFSLCKDKLLEKVIEKFK